MGGCDRRSRPARAFLRVGFADAAARGAPACGRPPRRTSSGGSVRDALLDRDIVDVDIATDARPDAIEAVVRPWADAVWLQGQRFGTVGCEKDGERFEITTFRADVYRPESRKPEVTFSDDIETDLSRRDFTVNAMAIALDDVDRQRARSSSIPFDGLARSRRAPTAHAARARDLVRGRSAAHAARGALRRDARLRTRRRARRRDRGDARAAEDRERRAHPRRAVEADRRRRSVAGVVAELAHRSVRTSSCPS